MARLPRPTIAHPIFLPGGSGTTSCGEAVASNGRARLGATKPIPALLRKSRRVLSFFVAPDSGKSDPAASDPRQSDMMRLLLDSLDYGRALQGAPGKL